MKEAVIIEVSGGNVIATHSTIPMDIWYIDHDNINAGTEFPCWPLEEDYLINKNLNSYISELREKFE